MLAACATGRPAPPASTAAPATTASSKLDVLTDRLGPPLTTNTGTCPSPGRNVDQLRPATLPRSTWRLAWTEAEEGQLAEATVTPDGALWALRGSGRTQWPAQWTGSSWKQLPALPLGEDLLVRLGAASADRAWVIVESAAATYVLSTWDGRAWRSEQVDLGVQAVSGEELAAQGAWVLLGDRSMRWSGTAWQTAPLHSYSYKLSGSTDEPWVIASSDPDAEQARIQLSRWTDRGWQAVPLPDGMLLPPGTEAVHPDKPWTRIAGVARTGPAEFWVAGTYSWGEHEPVDQEDVTISRSVVMRNAAGRWSCWWGPVGDQSDPFVDMVPDGRGGLWAATGSGMLWHLSDGRWTRERAPVDQGVPEITDLAASPGGEIYALGGIGSEQWAQDARPALWLLEP
ncbi:hypothetical protein [Nonomuraea sp. NPDC005692]|uniref:hypothetical protein n=1 Tax=Nonomuraea sp. NPDC005692 TaxID=3157168 RepID=UPI0033E99D14